MMGVNGVGCGWSRSGSWVGGLDKGSGWELGGGSWVG